MKRSTLDRMISTSGIVVAVVLTMMTVALIWTHKFIHSQVTKQLSAQKITFPAAGSAGLSALSDADKTAVSKYAGQSLTTGAQAEVFADHYIAAHLKKIGGGKTYSELSAASLADPSNQALVGQVQTVFRGETLRGMLLNAYAFDTMATVALYVAYGAFVAAVLVAVLAVLGFHHAKTVKPTRRQR